MARRVGRWDRTCPDCHTTFSSVQEWGVCPNCLLYFLVDRDGTVLNHGTRPEDRIQPPRDIVVPENIEERIKALPSWLVDWVKRDFGEAEQAEVLRMLACCDDGEDLIWKTILKRAKGDKVYLRSMAITAQEDWRDLLGGGEVRLPSSYDPEDEAPNTDRGCCPWLGQFSRWAAITVVAVALLWLCLQHGHGRAKGTYAPLPNMAASMCLAAAAAFLCKRYWLTMAAPFIAGIAGVFGIGDPHCGPYGGVLGLLVGLLMVLLPIGKRAKPR